MKTYCKPSTVNIESWEFNAPAVRKCLKNKLGRRDFQRLLCDTGAITKQEIALGMLSGDKARILYAENELSKMLTDRIRNRDLQLKPIRQFKRVDGMTHKERDICQESPEQQVYEYMAVHALQPLFQAKLLPVQYGSIPQKGQLAAKRKIERLIRKKFCGRKVCVIKGDIRKAYPSITIEKVMEFLRRDVGKNKPLIWFLESVMSNYPGEHLCIGGYLPAWLFNYTMSYLLRHIYGLHQIRRGKRYNLVDGIVCYADDFAMFGNFSKLRKAMKKATIWAASTLGIKIKQAWQIYHIPPLEAELENHDCRSAGSMKRTDGVDMVGYVVRHSHTIIRSRVFLRIRRQTIRAWADYKRLGYVPWWRACRIASYKGWVKYSNSEHFVQKYHFKELLALCKKSASKHGKELAHEQRELLIAAAAY